MDERSGPLAAQGEARRLELSTQLSLPQPRRAGGEAPTPTTGSCLEEQELVAMVDGTLDSERSDAVLAHVDSCPACADLVGSLGAFSEEPRKLGRYRIERLLGVGGMGMVYRAWDPELQRPVAIKLVRPEHANERSKARMLGEARALARVSHPNVIGVYDVGEHAGEIFLATELVEGETLATWRTGRDAGALVEAWLQVARGLAAAHAEGVVHRDVKPANVLVGRDGRMRIGDFGIAYQLGGGGERRAAASAEAKAVEPTRTGEDSAARSAVAASGSESESESRSGSGSESASGSGSESGSAARSTPALAPTARGTPARPITVSEVVGTPAYMAPEQHDGKVDARSDQFSVCVALVTQSSLSLSLPDTSAPAIVTLRSATRGSQRLTGTATAMTGRVSACGWIGLSTSASSSAPYSRRMTRVARGVDRMSPSDWEVCSQPLSHRPVCRSMPAMRQLCEDVVADTGALLAAGAVPTASTGAGAGAAVGAAGLCGRRLSRRYFASASAAWMISPGTRQMPRCQKPWITS
jgi:serine/threonine protein kinase